MTTPSTVILHLSDIHFAKPTRGADVYDLDEDLRNELEIDALDVKAKSLGHVDVIIVTGDVVFSGQEPQYNLVGEWLKRLAEKLNCPADRVWIVPGNHDVDWAQVDLSVSLAHQRLRSIEGRKLNEEFTACLLDPRVGETLFRPMRAYLDFAKRFHCDFSQEQPFWEKDLLLNDGSTLRVRGLTSIFVSDRGDVEGQMVLGSAPATLHRTPDVEYMVLSHHPIDWFRDREEIEDLLVSRGRILLFGHKHRQRIRRADDSVVLTAGAVHPYRAERRWQPRYNYVSVSVSGSPAERNLQVEVFPRVWGDESRRFEPEAFKGQFSRRYTFELPPRTLGVIPPHTGVREPVATQAVSSDTAVIMSMALEAVAGTAREKNVMDAALKLADRFWRLPYHLRARILRQLGLIEDGEKSLPEEEKVVLAFRRARERDQLEAVRAAVEEYSGPTGEPNSKAGVAGLGG